MGLGGGLGRNLAGQIDGFGHIHGDQAVVARDDERIVDVIRRMELDGRIVVQKLVQVLVSQSGRGHHLAFVEPFFAIVDHAGGVKVHHVVGQKLGVEPQIVLLRQRLHGRLAGRVQTDLQGRPVLDETRDLATDLDGDLRLRGRLDRQQILLVLHDDVHIVDMDEALPHHPRHARIDLSDHQVGRVGRGTRDVHGNPQAHPAEIVRRADLDERHVDRHLAAFEQDRHIRNVHGRDKPHVVGEPERTARPEVKVPDAHVHVMGPVGDLGQRRALVAHHTHDFQTGQIA